jgi:hypothetical protein
MLGAASVGGCGEQEAGEASPGHVHGLVVLAPSCPVETVGEACAPRPAAGVRVEVSEAGSEPPRLLETGDDGRFEHDLDAGTYTFAARPAGGPAASSNAVPVTVRSGQEATVRLDIDSGIR